MRFPSHVAKLLAGLLFAAATGCGYLPSRKCCPVYLPNDHLLGSEAIRVPPCGPDVAFHGLKKTHWRHWPEDWKFWQPFVPFEEEYAEPIPYVKPESIEPIRPLEPREDARGAEDQPEPRDSEQRVEPDDSFRLEDSLWPEEPVPPRQTLPELDDVEPAVPSESAKPIELFDQPPLAPIERSSWTYPEEAERPLAHKPEPFEPAAGARPAQRPAHANWRAPRPSKLRR